MPKASDPAKRAARIQAWSGDRLAKAGAESVAANWTKA